MYALVPEKERGEKGIYLTHATWSLEWGPYLSIDKRVHLEVSEGSSSRSGATSVGLMHAWKVDVAAASCPKSLWTRGPRGGLQ